MNQTEGRARLKGPFRPTGLAINKIAFRRTIPVLAIVAAARLTALPVAADTPQQRDGCNGKRDQADISAAKKLGPDVVWDFAAVIAK
jgi:hypothetical protein